MLKGEIHLRSDLITSSSIAHFRIEVRFIRSMAHHTSHSDLLQYSVVLFPFAPSGYESLDVEPLIVQSVEIASDLPPGPRPLQYSTVLQQ